VVFYLGFCGFISMNLHLSVNDVLRIANLERTRRSAREQNLPHVTQRISNAQTTSVSQGAGVAVNPFSVHKPLFLQRDAENVYFTILDHDEDCRDGSDEKVRGLN